MGLGDDVMATAFAEAAVLTVKARDGLPSKVVFGEWDHVAQKMRAHWSDVFRHNPRIVDPGEGWAGDVTCVPEYPGSRQYVDYAKCDISPAGGIEAFAFRPGFRAPRGTVLFSAGELAAWSAWHGDLDVVVEPNVKGEFGTNKAWPWDRWEDLVASLRARGRRVSQFVYPGASCLVNVEPIRTDSFREACYALSRANLIVTTDGGLHHAAAALGVPAVVLWSHFSSPEILGYEYHVNVRAATGHGCGTLWKECEECRTSMNQLPVAVVAQAVLVASAGNRHPTTWNDSPSILRPQTAAAEPTDGGPVFRIANATPGAHSPGSA